MKLAWFPFTLARFTISPGRITGAKIQNNRKVLLVESKYQKIFLSSFYDTIRFWRWCNKRMKNIINLMNHLIEFLDGLLGFSYHSPDDFGAGFNVINHLNRLSGLPKIVVVSWNDGLF